MLMLFWGIVLYAVQIFKVALPFAFVDEILEYKMKATLYFSERLSSCLCFIAFAKLNILF